MDSHAAHIVMTRYLNVHLVTWTLTLAQPLPWADVDLYLASGTASAALMQSVMARDLDKWKGDKEYPKGWVACDPMAAAVLVDPALVLASRAVTCDVLWDHGEGTRGQSVFDVASRDGAASTPLHNVHLVEEVDLVRFRELFLASVAATDLLK